MELSVFLYPKEMKTHIFVSYWCPDKVLHSGGEIHRWNKGAAFEI